MKLRLPTFVLLIVGLAGCATAPTYPTPTQVAQTFRPYAFGPVEALFPRVGAPTRVVSMGQGKVYVWHATAVWRGSYPVTTIHHGAIGTGNAMDGPPLQYAEASTSMHTETADLACDLEVFTDAAGKVRNVVVKGQAGACQEFMPQ